MGTQSKKTSKSEFFELFKTLFIAIVLATTFRSFAFEPFHIPSGSMKDTLLVGDYLFVSKYAYGYSRYSFPFGLPLFEGRVGGKDGPERGDVVVFRLPSYPKIDYIKRVIGLPGDHIQMRGGKLYINGRQAPQSPLENFMDSDPAGADAVSIPRYTETLPEGKKHHVLDQDPNGQLDTTPEYVVPEGHYFMMGDNRDNSRDSRVLGAVGYVPAENIVGRAEVIFFSTDGSARFWELWKWPFSLRMDRFFQWIE